MKISHKFVTNIPEELEENTIYISIEYSSAIHKCACGCGNQVVTPFSPTDWKLIFNGETISLYPSIGNWSFPCQSHYWINNNYVEWAPKWTKTQIETGRGKNKTNEKSYYEKKDINFLYKMFKMITKKGSGERTNPE